MTRFTAQPCSLPLSSRHDLRADDSIEGLQLREFFLVLSPMGLAYRHCRLVWINGDQIGVSFANRSRAPKKKADTKKAQA